MEGNKFFFFVAHMYTYLDLPNSAELIIKAAHTPSLSEDAVYIHIYDFPSNNIW